MNALLDEKKLHLVFDASLWFKAAFALSEVLAGIIAYFVQKPLLLPYFAWVTQNEFAEDPRDLVANFLLHTIPHLSVGTQRFAALYLLAHGIVKLRLITITRDSSSPSLPKSSITDCVSEGARRSIR